MKCFRRASITMMLATFAVFVAADLSAAPLDVVRFRAPALESDRPQDIDPSGNWIRYVYEDTAGSGALSSVTRSYEYGVASLSGRANGVDVGASARASAFKLAEEDFQTSMFAETRVLSERSYLIWNTRGSLPSNPYIKVRSNAHGIMSATGLYTDANISAGVLDTVDKIGAGNSASFLYTAVENVQPGNGPFGASGALNYIDVQELEDGREFRAEFDTLIRFYPLVDDPDFAKIHITTVMEASARAYSRYDEEGEEVTRPGRAIASGIDTMTITFLTAGGIPLEEAGYRIVEIVPEPSSLTCCAVGAIGFILVGRKWIARRRAA